MPDRDSATRKIAGPAMQVEAPRPPGGQIDGPTAEFTQAQLGALQVRDQRHIAMRPLGRGA